MPTRREVLMGLAVTPLCAASSVPFPAVLSEAHCLSEESACGYRLLFGDLPKRRIVVAAGIRNLSLDRCRHWRAEISAGGWLVLEAGMCFCAAHEIERQASILQDGLGLRLMPGRNARTNVEYRWPLTRMVRSFEAVFPVECGRDEAIAWHEGQPVCARRRVGKGGMIYLGSMLGPGLFAREREAHEVGRALLAGLG